MDPIQKAGTNGGGKPRTNTSDIPKAALRTEAQRLIESAFAKNTVDAYKVGIRRFESFKTKYTERLCWPPTIEQLTLFIAFLSLQGLSYKTASLYLCAVGFQLYRLTKSGSTKQKEER